MPRIARNVAIFALLFVILPAAATGEIDTPVAALARLAAAISRNDAPAALAVFDRQMPAYGTVETAIAALTAQSDVLLSIEILTESQTPEAKTLDTDWFMQIKPRIDGGPAERRRQRISLTLRMLRGQWRITAISHPQVLLPPA